MELCDNLADGGTTPSAGMVRWTLEGSVVPAYPIVRCRGGGFVHSTDEVAIMLDDISRFRELGCRGVVTGSLTPAGAVDRDFLLRAIDAADGMEITFHRAFDVCRDPFEALELLVDLGVTRVLTSGQKATVWEGRHLIARLVEQAGGRLIVMAGGGAREENVAELIALTGVTEIHFRGGMERHEPPGWPAPDIPFRKPLPADEHSRYVTGIDRVRRMRAALDD